MTDPAPADPVWLRKLLARSPLLPEPGLRRHWQRVVPYLTVEQRYELAAILVEAEARG